MWRNVLRLSPETSLKCLRNSSRRLFSEDSSRLLSVRRLARRVCRTYRALPEGEMQPLTALLLRWEHKTWDDFFEHSSPMINGWRSVAQATDFDAVVEALADRGIYLNDPTPPTDVNRRSQVLYGGDYFSLPTWVVLYVLCTKVRTAEDTKRALSLVYGHLPYAHWRWRGALLIICVGWVAHFNMTVPLKQLLDLFFMSKNRLRVEYHLLFMVLCMTCRSHASAELISPLVAETSSRRIPIEQSTYDRLLAMPFATAQLGLVIIEAMELQGIELTRRNLERLVKLFAKRGSARLAGRTIRQTRHRFYRPAQEDAFSTAEVGRMLLAQDWYLASLKPTHVHTHMQARAQRLALDQPRASIWRAVLRSATEDKSMTPATLLALYRMGKSLNPAASVDFVVDLITMSGLLDRGAYASALSIWDSIFDKTDEMLEWGLSLGVRALTFGSRLREAFDLMLTHVPLDKALQPAPTHWAGDLSGRRRLAIPIVNVFLHSLQQTHRPDAVFELWDNLQILFSVHPDKYTLAIMLKTAIHAGAPDLSFRSALADIGFSFLAGPQYGADPSPENCRSLAVARVRELLSTPRGDVDTSMWDGERVGVRALRLTRRILLENWPELQYVVAPACKSSEAQGPKPLKRFLLRMQERKSASDASDDPTSLDDDKPPELWPHPQIVPNDVVFRAYIDLLGLEMRRTEIPVALAWMRHLSVKPTRSTLATALVYWGEIRMSAPLVESYLDEESPYRRLVAWMGEWVGVNNLPAERHVGQQMYRIRALREMREKNTR